LASQVLPRLKLSFAVTDQFCFNCACALSFGTRLLITALSSSCAILVGTFLISSFELGSSVFILNLSFRRLKRLEPTSQDRPTTFLQGEIRANESALQSTTSFQGEIPMQSTTSFQGEIQANESESTRLALWTARRQMSTEIILVINELFIEFFTSSATLVMGVAVGSSGPLSHRLSSEVSWSELSMFAIFTSGPELLDAFLIVVYLRHVGVDWLALCKTILSDGRLLLVKVLCMLGCLLTLMLIGIDSQ